MSKKKTQDFNFKIVTPVLVLQTRTGVYNTSDEEMLTDHLNAFYYEDDLELGIKSEVILTKEMELTQIQLDNLGIPRLSILSITPKASETKQDRFRRIIEEKELEVNKLKNEYADAYKTNYPDVTKSKIISKKKK